MMQVSEISHASTSDLRTLKRGGDSRFGGPSSKAPRELILGCFDKPKILKGVRVYEFERRQEAFRPR